MRPTSLAALLLAKWAGDGSQLLNLHDRGTSHSIVYSGQKADTPERAEQYVGIRRRRLV